MSTCPGSGQRWMHGMGRAICKVCHVSAGTILDPKYGVRSGAGWPQRAGALVRDPNALVPVHEHQGAPR